MKYMRIAIDGPAQVGKSSTAALLAKKLNFPHLNSGNLYRTITAYILKHKIKDFSFLLNKKFLIRNARYFFDGVDLTDSLRSNKVNENVAIYAKHEKIRQIIRKIQREIIEANQNIIIDGRDIGSCVCREADFKIFLTTDINVRIQRFHGNFDEILRRDENDMNREHGALKKTEDAIVVDNSNMTLDETVDYILMKIKK